MITEMTELTLEEMESETGVNKVEECLADYLVCRNALLREYGVEHFLDLHSVVSEEARKKLDYLMHRYVCETEKRNPSAPSFSKICPVYTGHFPNCPVY